VKGLNVRVLGQIQELDERECEREELLTELIPEIEAREHDKEAVKAVLGS
jgi:hypothetical protein